MSFMSVYVSVMSMLLSWNVLWNVVNIAKQNLNFVYLKGAKTYT